MLTQSSAGVELNQDFMWSEAALAADIAELSFLAAITAAPLFWTVGTNSVSSQAWSSPTACPLQVAWPASGNWVEEWLPQMVTFLMAEIGCPSLLASWAAALFWSSLELF